VILLHGDTRIEVGDRIVALVGPDCVQEVREMFLGAEASSLAGPAKVRLDEG